MHFIVSILATSAPALFCGTASSKCGRIASGRQWCAIAATLATTRTRPHRTRW